MSGTNSIAERFRRQAANAGRNMHESKGGAAPIPEGRGMMRLIGVIEIGKQLKTYQRNVIERDQVFLTLELSGPVWQPQDGRLPILTERYTNSDSSKSGLFKLFKAVDPDDEYSHIGEMLGKVFIGEVEHNKAKSSNKVYANAKNISTAVVKDPATGEVTDYNKKALPQVAKAMGFLWDFPLLEDWDNLYIEGKYDDGGSKNKFQQAIRAAVDFEDSPIFELLSENGRDPWADYTPDGEVVMDSSDRNYREVTTLQDRIRSGKGASEPDNEGDEAPQSNRRGAPRSNSTSSRAGGAPPRALPGRSTSRPAGRSTAPADTGDEDDAWG